MMKRIIPLIMTLILCMTLVVQVSAAQRPRLVDSADLLTDLQETELLDRLDRVSSELRVDLVIVAMESLGGYSPEQAVRNYCDNYGFGYGVDRNCVILMIAMESRDWQIYCRGSVERYITQPETAQIGKSIVGDLSDGNYYTAFSDFINLCEREISSGPHSASFNVRRSLLVSIVVGLVAALVATFVMRSNLKSVRIQSGAREYVKPGSVFLTRSSDIYLYSTITEKVRKNDDDDDDDRSFSFGGGHSSGGHF